LPGHLLARILVALVASLLYLWFWASGMTHAPAPRFEPPQPQSFAPSAPAFAARFASASETPEVHASTAYAPTTTGVAGVTAFWYGGTREGAADVAIYRSRLGNDGWSQPQRLLDRRQLAEALNRHVRKVGNATVYRHPDGRLWMFVVTVSVGGWAGSSISLVESTDNGATWSRARRLVTSPFFNFSTLVRGSAFRYADGSIGLPVYHEFVGKFAELLRIDGDGRILERTRLTSGRHALQPEVAILDEQQAVALLRYAGDAPRRVLHSITVDGGRTWTEPDKIAVPNPDSAVDLLPLDRDRLLAVFNDLDDHRFRLTLAVSEDAGRHWRSLRVLEDRPEGDRSHHEYSYPWLLRAEDGDFHLLYTWNRRRIKHVQFNRSWLDLQLAKPAVEVSPRGTQ
jgi:predicted neuraminidase